MVLPTGGKPIFWDFLQPIFGFSLLGALIPFLTVQAQVVPSTTAPALDTAKVVPLVSPTKMSGKAPYKKGIHDGMANELQPLTKRANYGRMLEPKDKVMHGVGQSGDAFRNYATAAGPDLQPSVYMTYHNLSTLGDGTRLRKDLQRIANLPYPAIPQLGLPMTFDGQPEKHYEHLVAAGQHDADIQTFIREIKAFNRPIYLRLGYEFNGFWNGYEAKSYIAAYRHVADAIRASGLKNVALVWCFAVDSDQDDYMQFYPGDNYVDWWSIDVFSAWQFERPELWNFLDSAKARKYPVMIGECTPRRMSVSKGDSSWRLWFVPYFNMVRLYPNLKGTSYINWNWQGTSWPDWGDARIEAAPEDLRKKYLKELSQPWYLHSTRKNRKFLLGQ